MKRNISDLLDNLPVEDMELEHMSLLSARRIKKKTMNKIVAPKSRSVRWLCRVATVAAVIAALGITAFAAGVAMDGKNPLGYSGNSFKHYHNAYVFGASVYKCYYTNIFCKI